MMNLDPAAFLQQYAKGVSTQLPLMRERSDEEMGYGETPSIAVDERYVPLRSTTTI